MAQLRVIGCNISVFRKKMNITQQDLAEKLHVTHQAVSKWERGESAPDIETLVKISNILNTTLNELILGSANSENIGISHQECNHIPLNQFNIQIIWDAVLNKIKASIPEPSYFVWFKGTFAVLEENNIVINYFGSKHKEEWISSRYLTTIRILLREITGSTSFKLSFRLNQQENTLDS